MVIAFLIAACLAILSSTMVITCAHAIHALLYLILSFISVAVIFFILGAPFAAALEVIIYGGAIMVLFIFVIMMLDLHRSLRQEKDYLRPTAWVVPCIMTLILGAEVIYVTAFTGASTTIGSTVTPKQVGVSLFGPYLLGVELASVLLLAGLVGAYHLAHHLLRRARYEEDERT
ncbi:MAG TPA: NADH-quinone oxidoreductase subunit J [Syntrophorhabdaceae bacterium]|nr:NADH-quinone oxidoreductase subunit J [Syntrophorhabdaceae bacterium]